MQRNCKPVIIWLLLGCVLIAGMVVIGGITRLTHSGLSMVEWDPIMGSVPPTTESEWQETFDKYKQFPEYQKKNVGMELEEFKSIFFWEYLHRMWGRMMGVVFLIPFLFFWARGYLKGDLFRKMLLILLGGALVAGLGWFMVLSGLKDMPDVSHYRLAIHLVAAFSLFAYILWVALDLIYPSKDKVPKFQKPMIRGIWILFLLVLIQVIYGAFVAGTGAGFVFNSFPLMGGSLFPSGIVSLDPWWLNFFEGRGGVQFVHRVLAVVILLQTGVLLYRSRKFSLLPSQSGSIRLLVVSILVQFTLGVFTLLYAVPIELGILHQVGALLLLASVVLAMHRFQRRAMVLTSS